MSGTDCIGSTEDAGLENDAPYSSTTLIKKRSNIIKVHFVGGQIQTILDCQTDTDKIHCIIHNPNFSRSDHDIKCPVTK